MATTTAAEASSLEAQFERCVARVRADNATKLGDDRKLRLYGLFKQAKEGDNATKAPGLLDFVGRSKWNAWAALKGTAPAAAMQEYVDCVAQWFPPAETGAAAAEGPTSPSSPSASPAAAAADSSASGGGGGGGGGLTFGAGHVSSMGAIGLDGRVIDDQGPGGKEEKRDVFYFAKEGMVDEIERCLEREGASVDAQDEEGRSLLHWAADGGHAALAEFLLRRGADATLRDAEGDTPHDYAVLCEYAELAALLEQHQKDKERGAT